MSMGTKDYKAIASKLCALCKHTLTYREKQLLLAVANELADYFERGNSAFQRQRFMDATGTNVFVGEGI